MVLQIFNENDFGTSSALKGAGKGDFHTGIVFSGGNKADVIKAPGKPRVGAGGDTVFLLGKFRSFGSFEIIIGGCKGFFFSIGITEIDFLVAVLIRLVNGRLIVPITCLQRKC